jgi:cob(I)alamin adenosyltransferase
MLYTRKGDSGTTKTFSCDQRISKSSAIAEALGSLDEINSFLGLVKVKAESLSLEFTGETFHLADVINQIQQDLFIVQAELAGADKKIAKEKVVWLEHLVDGVEKLLPPIKTFFVSGGTELSSLFDIARTIARRAERRVVGVAEEQAVTIGADTLAYLNRLSSVLYAFARWVNHQSGHSEKSPTYT